MQTIHIIGHSTFLRIMLIKIKLKLNDPIKDMFNVLGRLAQSGASLTANQGVAGSIPGPITLFC